MFSANCRMCRARELFLFVFYSSLSCQWTHPSDRISVVTNTRGLGPVDVCMFLCSNNNIQNVYSALYNLLGDSSKVLRMYVFMVACLFVCLFVWMLGVFGNMCVDVCVHVCKSIASPPYVCVCVSVCLSVYRPSLPGMGMCVCVCVCCTICLVRDCCRLRYQMSYVTSNNQTHHFI